MANAFHEWLIPMSSSSHSFADQPVLKIDHGTSDVDSRGDVSAWCELLEAGDSDVLSAAADTAAEKPTASNGAF